MFDLKTQAEELGIKVDGRWSDARIQEEIDKVLADDSGPESDNSEEDSDLVSAPDSNDSAEEEDSTDSDESGEAESDEDQEAPEESDARIQEDTESPVAEEAGEDDQHADDAEANETIKNVSRVPWEIFRRKVLHPGESYTLTKKDLDDRKGIMRVKRAIAMGKLEVC